jgi:hypothetical protein
MASTPQSTERSTTTGTPERPVAAPQASGAVAERPGKTTAALVLGIVGVIASFFIPILGIILGVLAIVFGTQMRKALANGRPGHGQATAGFILGIIAVVLGVIVWIVAAATIMS